MKPRSVDLRIEKSRDYLPFCSRAELLISDPSHSTPFSDPLVLICGTQ